jgi:HK97 family phage prohead protease
MRRTVTLKGYDCVFGVERFTDEGIDVVKPGAFAAAVEKNQRIPLLWSDHSGELIGKADLLFEDDFGLAFAAKIDLSEHQEKIIEIVSGRCAKAGRVRQLRSVMSPIGDAQTHTTITASDLGHIALVSNPGFRGTWVWRGDSDADLERAPGDIWYADRRWREGYEAFAKSREVKAPSAPSHPAPPPAFNSFLARLAYVPCGMRKETRARARAMLGPPRRRV